MCIVRNAIFFKSHINRIVKEYLNIFDQSCINLFNYFKFTMPIFRNVFFKSFVNYFLFYEFRSIKILVEDRRKNSIKHAVQIMVYV